MTASSASSSHRETFHVPVDPDLEYEEVYLWPDEVAVGCIVAGFVVTGVAAADHYRLPARRWTIFTDPDSLPDGVESTECGRMVVVIDRSKGHQIPVLRPVRD